MAKVASLRQRIAKDLPDVIDALIREAKEGDAQAARTLIERVLPPVKPVELPVTLAVPDEASPLDIGKALVLAVAAGHLAPAQAATLMSTLAGLTRLVETEELKNRIEALEARNPLRKQ